MRNETTQLEDAMTHNTEAAKNHVASRMRRRAEEMIRDEVQLAVERFEAELWESLRKVALMDFAKMVQVVEADGKLTVTIEAPKEPDEDPRNSIP